MAHDVSATPKLRPCAFTLRAIAGDLGERPARLGLRAGDLLDEDGDADAATAGRVEAVLNGDVVVREHRLDLDPFVLGQLGRHAEVEHVAGVVLDDVHDARAAVDGLRRREHLVGHGRGEDGSRTGGVEHADPDEAAVQRLVPAPSARDQGDLAADRGSLADDDLILEIDGQEIGVRGLEPGERLGDEVVRVVEELLDCRNIRAAHLFLSS